MMDRARARELFSDYLERSLDSDTKTAFETYIATDPTIQTELESFKQTLKSLQQLRFSTPQPKAFVKKVEQRIRRRSRGRFFGKSAASRLPFEWFSFVIILVLLVLYLFVALDVHRIQNEPSDDSLPKTPTREKPASGVGFLKSPF